MQITIKRVYLPPSDDDGHRVLVDRMWPRGISKERASWQEWDKTIAPSSELRKWFSHDPNKWEAFKKRYRDELIQQKQECLRLLSLAKTDKLTLLYGAKDEHHNQAIVLQEYLLELSKN